MNDDVAVLEITPYELEKICGHEVNDLFIGGIVGGVLRSSACHHPKQLLSLCVIEVAVAGLLLMFTLPLSFALTRYLTNNQQPDEFLFLAITIGIAMSLMTLWNLSIFLRSRPFKKLMRLLDEVDRFNELVRAVDVVDRLEAAQPRSNRFEDRLEIVNALNVTRDSLISGLITEKILREHRSLLSQHQDLLRHLELNFSSLSAMALRDEGHEYSRILKEALQIGVIVQREMKDEIKP